MLGSRFQVVGQKGKVDRGRHVWYQKKGSDDWKCVLCGGITRQPTDNEACRHYEELTEDERAMSPPS